MSDRVTDWVTGYRRAWESSAPDDIRALFTPDAEYRGHPSEEPWVGHEAIVAGWLEHADPPGSTTFRWQSVAVEGEVAVVQGVSGYPEGPKGGTYDNLWVIRFANDGRAASFTDWWIPRP